MWRYRELYAEARTIGLKTEADVELLSVRNGLLKFQPKVVPGNFPETASGETHLWVTVVARGLDAESVPLRLKIDWDGKWERVDSEMVRHFAISPAN